MNVDIPSHQILDVSGPAKLFDLQALCRQDFDIFRCAMHGTARPLFGKIAPAKVFAHGDRRKVRQNSYAIIFVDEQGGKLPRAALAKYLSEAHITQRCECKNHARIIRCKFCVVKWVKTVWKPPNPCLQKTTPSPFCCSPSHHPRFEQG